MILQLPFTSFCMQQKRAFDPTLESIYAISAACREPVRGHKAKQQESPNRKRKEKEQKLTEKKIWKKDFLSLGHLDSDSSSNVAGEAV